MEGTPLGFAFDRYHGHVGGLGVHGSKTPWVRACLGKDCLKCNQLL